ncbi:MAG TPA: serine/threonine-protein kinase [Candidatus Caenarcaniphilales bacterium]
MSASFSDPNLGQLLINRYQLRELIGKGAMGRVYRAEDTLLGGVPVAVKFLAQTLLSERMKVRFAHEARTGAQLGQKSIHIVRVIDYGVNQDEVPFYVMEYLLGASLGDLITTRPLSLQQFLTLIRHVCLGLHCAHGGININGELCPIIHRDIKPSNVLVVPNPSLGQLAKILDFGIAKFLSDQIDSNQTHSFMGTPAYCSPEQMAGHELDNRSDIYSLGVTMFELLTGQLPIQPETHSINGWYQAHQSQKPYTFNAVNPTLNLPKPIENLVMSCLAKSPRDRPQTMSEILNALDHLEQPGSLARQVDQPIKARAPEPQSLQKPKLQNTFSVEGACWQASWPADKPLAEIVFSRPIRTQTEATASLWVMLPQAEVQQRLLSIRYNQFLCLMSPHPVVLWITAIYDRSLGPRWLPCYLDLKNTQSQEIVFLLDQSGYYPLLLFASEIPQRCANVMSFTIAPYQRQLLQAWHQQGETIKSTAPPTVTRSLLKSELERIKPQIIQKLESTKRSTPAG